MRNDQLLALTLGMLATVLPRSLTAGEPSEFNRSEDVAAIMAVEEAAGTTNSLDKFLSYVTNDAVFADLTSPDWLEGKAQIRVAFAPQFDGLKILHFQVNDKTIVTDGKMGCVAMGVHVDATAKSNAPISVTFRELDAFRKADNRWEWVAQQVSFPVDRTTGAAVTNDQPPARDSLEWTGNPVRGPAVTPEQAKREIEDWRNGRWRETNIDDMAAYYGPGDNFIVYDKFLPGEYRGLKELHDAYAPAYANLETSDIHSPSDMIYSDGLLGVMTSRANLDMSMKDGAEQSTSFRQTDCLRRDDGKWHAFFEMVSSPIDKKTGKPTTSSSPTAP